MHVHCYKAKLSSLCNIETVHYTNTAHILFTRLEIGFVVMKSSFYFTWESCIMNDYCLQCLSWENYLFSVSVCDHSWSDSVPGIICHNICSSILYENNYTYYKLYFIWCGLSVIPLTPHFQQHKQGLIICFILLPTHSRLLNKAKWCILIT